MTLYLDSSVLVKLYIDEPDSASIAVLVQDASVVATSAIAYAEVRAAFARRRRERLMTPRELARAREQLDADWRSLLIVGVDDALALQAGSLAEVHGLRGADAVHLAAFERVMTGSDDEDVRFSCADDRLNRAAGDLGEDPGERAMLQT